MGKWNREELEAAFETYQQTAPAAATRADWNASPALSTD
ncbi:MAG: nuclear transport factor 2 family protein, partial [bacterium]|nr:nuclear transport factor 2 family protein [bacterium]